MNEIKILNNAFKFLKTAKLNKRRVFLLILAFILILGALWLIFKPSKLLAYETGESFTENLKFRENENGDYYATFTAKQNFQINWGLYGASCHQDPYATSGFPSITLVSSDFASTSGRGYYAHSFIQTNDLDLFLGGCPVSENYLSGQDYSVFLIPDDHYNSYNHIASTSLYSNLVNTTNDPNIDTESIFYIYEPYFDYASSTWKQYKSIDYSLNTSAFWDITYPADNSTQTTNFNFVGNFNTYGADYERIMVILEDWDASSTCPLYNDPDFSTQYSLYFNYQSKPYFSDYFSAPNGIATTSISDISAGNYNCVHCYFINETEGTYSDEICQGFSVNIPTSLSPEIPTFYTGQNWTDYYAAHTEKWASSTELFYNLALKTSPILDWVGNFTSNFRNLFNNSSSTIMGTDYGQAIPKARGYLGIINEWFSGLPVSEIFIFYLFTALIIIVMKIVLMIWHFFRG